MEESQEEKKKEVVKGKSHLFKYSTIGLLIVLLIVSGFLFFGKRYFSSDKEEIVAKVDGEKIYASDLDNVYSSLQQQQQLGITKGAVLDRLVQSKVLYLEAKKKGYSVSKEEAKKEIESLLLSSGASREQFLQSLKLQGITEDEFTDKYIEQMILQKFIGSEVANKIKISDKEVKDYYLNNMKIFERGEQVTVRHILIGNSSLSVKEKEDKANSLLKKVNENNFCDYVKGYSTDVASVPTCGEYTFGKNDSYVEEFKNLSFSQKVGDIGTVNTQFGTHIILTVNKSDAGYIGFDEVSKQIEDFLSSRKMVDELQKLYEELKGGDNIKILYKGL